MKNTSETKQKLLDTTRLMIDTGGIDAVNMRDLGKEIELSRSAVYRHFASKDDLLATIAMEDFKFQTSAINELAAGIDDPQKLICEILCAFYHFGMEKPAHYQLMFIKQWDKELYSDLHIAARNLYSVIENAFEKVTTSNQLAKELTAMATAFIVGLVELNTSGHFDPEKGFDDASGLIQTFTNRIILKK